MSSFGPYTLIRRLAVGGMAEIFLAKREGPAGFSKVVALKHILPHLAGAKDFVDMFLDEARIAARLDHPNIVQIHDFGAHEGSYFLAMEYVPGDDLSTLLTRAQRAGRSMPLKLATMVLAATCQALHHAHELYDERGRPLGIVHRDVSPSNLLLSIDGVVKLTDFGVAKAERKISQTMVGTRKGKGAYMSPEQAHGRPVDRRSDVFSLGAIAWELVTGERLFQRDGDVETLKAVTEGAIRAPRELRPELPDDLEAVILRALDRNPAERWPTARSMQRALEEASRAYRELATTGDLAAEVRELLGPEEVRLRERWAAGDVAEAIDQTAKLSTRAIAGPLTEPSIPLDTSSIEILLTPPTLTLERAGALRATRDDEPTTRQPTGDAHALGRFLRGGPTPGSDEPTLPPDPPTLPYPDRTEPSAPPRSPDATTPSPGARPDRAPALLSLSDVPAAPPRRRRWPWVAVLLLGSLAIALAFRAGRDASPGVVVVVDAATSALRIEPLPDAIEPTTTHVIAPVDGRPPTPPDAPPPLGSRPDASPRVRRPPSEPADRRAFLTVDVGDDLRVLLDDVDIGASPITRQPIDPGRHAIAYVSRAEGHRNESTFSVAAGATHTERLTLRAGQLACDTTPWAEVWVGPRKLGITPLPPVSLTQGTYSIRFFNPTLGREKLVKAKIAPGKTTRLRISFD